MSNYVFGIGLENETTYTFYNKNRTKVNYNAKRSIDTRKSDVNNLQYHSNTAHWNKNSGWESRRNEVVGDVVGVSGDSTVLGGTSYGIEFGTAKLSSLNVKPKDMIKNYEIALYEFGQNLRSDIDNPIVNKTPFASPVSFSNYGSDGPGSWHVNITMPYDKTKVASTEYLKNYNDKLFRGIKVVRAIQPLLMAMIGGADYKSVGNPNWAEGSSRQVFVGYGNLGNVRLDSEFRSKLNSPDFYYKHTRTSNGYRNKVKKLIDNNNVRTTTVGDIAMKRYGNVDRKIATIEYRFLDPFHTSVMYDVMKVMISALEHGSNVPDIADAGISSIWQDATAEIVVEGWNARLSKSYCKMLKDKLGLDIPIKDGIRADLLFNEVSTKLWDKNKGGEWVKVLFDEFSYPNVMNLNKLNWEAQFRHRYINDSNFTKYINKFLTTLLKIDTTDSNGWLNVEFKNDKYSIRDILVDDEKFGIDFASEDFEDFLFLLERIKAIEIKTDDVGHIEKIKVINTDLKDVLKDLDNIKDLDTDILSDVVTEPEPEVEPEPTPQPEREQEIISQRLSNINIDLLSIVRVTLERDSMADYNRRDLEQTFNIANYTNRQGENIRVFLGPAEIKYDNQPLYCFWKKLNDTTVRIFIDVNMLEDEETITDIISVIRNRFYSNLSVSESNVFVSNLTVTEFFNRLENVARNHYFKNRPEQIKLDRTGIEKLRQKGIVIVSLMRGKQYFIADKNKWNDLIRLYGENVRNVNYIPYQKNISVQRIGDKYNLMFKNKVVDSLGG